MLNASGLSRFVDVKEYKKFSNSSKKNYLRGSVDMLHVQLSNRFGNKNKVSDCMNKINRIDTYVYIYDNFIDKTKDKYNSYSGSEIFVLAIIEYCKK